MPAVSPADHPTAFGDALVGDEAENGNTNPVSTVSRDFQYQLKQT
jgi:hypothetical protein